VGAAGKTAVTANIVSLVILFHSGLLTGEKMATQEWRPTLNWFYEKAADNYTIIIIP